MSVKITRDRAMSVLASVRVLATREVLVGIPESESARDGEGGIGNAALAYIHDNGSPARNIPARPFMDEGIQNARPQVERRFRRAAELALDQRVAESLAQLEAAGFAASSAIKEKITEGPFVPLSPRTLAARRARGKLSDKPLTDTGQMRRAVTHIVRKRDADS